MVHKILRTRNLVRARPRKEGIMGIEGEVFVPRGYVVKEVEAVDGWKDIVVAGFGIIVASPCRRDGGLQALVAFPETGPLESLRRFLAVAGTVREWARKADYPASDYDDAERVRGEIVALAPWLAPIEGLGLAWYAWSHASFASELIITPRTLFQFLYFAGWRDMGERVRTAYVP